MSKKLKSRKNRRFQYANARASIQTRPNYSAQVGGESFTANREDELSASIYTDSSNASSFVLTLGGVDIAMSGRQARTIQRLLNKHYTECGDKEAMVPGLESSFSF